MLPHRWYWIGGAAICAAGLGGWFLFRVPGGCGATPIATTKLGADGATAVIFEYSCGATTGFATHVSVLRNGAFAVAPGNAFIADGDHGKARVTDWGGPWIEAVYVGDRAIRIYHDAAARVFKAEPYVNGYALEYVPVERPQ